jgi:hypothetical protein
LLWLCRNGPSTPHQMGCEHPQHTLTTVTPACLECTAHDPCFCFHHKISPASSPPSTQQRKYYYNKATKKSSWTRPAEMDAPPANVNPPQPQPHPFRPCRKTACLCPHPTHVNPLYTSTGRLTGHLCCCCPSSDTNTCRANRGCGRLAGAPRCSGKDLLLQHWVEKINVASPPRTSGSQNEGGGQKTAEYSQGTNMRQSVRSEM